MIGKRGAKFSVGRAAGGGAGGEEAPGADGEAGPGELGGALELLCRRGGGEAGEAVARRETEEAIGAGAW